MVLTNLFAEQQWRCRHREQTYGQRGREEGEGERNCLYYLHGITYTFSPLLFASLLFTAICKASSDSHLALLHFFPMEMVLIPFFCTMSRTSVRSSSGTLSIRSISHFHCVIIRDLISILRASNMLELSVCPQNLH